MAVRNVAVTCNPGNLKSTICNLKLRAAYFCHNEPRARRISDFRLKISDWKTSPVQKPGKAPFFAIFAPPLRSSRLKAF